MSDKTNVIVPNNSDRDLLNRVPNVKGAEQTVWVDMGNTQTRIALRHPSGTFQSIHIPTAQWIDHSHRRLQVPGLVEFFETAQGSQSKYTFGILASVAPTSVGAMLDQFRQIPQCSPMRWSQVGAHQNLGIGIDYPKPATIGADRLANAVAACRLFGGPSVVVDFGTAVTFDVVDASKSYVGGVICPGLNAMTDYLHEKTALLPRIEIQEIRTSIGKSTQEAMLIGAVHGYRGLIRSILHEIEAELKCPEIPCLATGGYAELISSGIPEIRQVDPWLTLKGLCWIGEFQWEKWDT